MFLQPHVLPRLFDLPARLDYTTFFSAIFVFGYTGITAYDFEAYTAAKNATGGQPFTPFHLLFAFKAQELSLWHWITLPAALITIILVIWMDKTRRYLAAGGTIRGNHFQVRLMLVLNQIKNGLSILWIVITFISFTLTAWRLGYLPKLFEFPMSIVESFAKYWAAI